MLDRDAALKICETVLEHAKAAGAEDANVVGAKLRRRARALCRQSRHHERARRGLVVTATVWVRAAAAPRPATMSSAATLKQLAEEAVQIARVSPVHREYVPTLGPSNLRRTNAGLRPARPTSISLARAAALRPCPCRVPRRER